MKIICTKSNLAKGVSIVSKAVPSKTTMPILECILIDATTAVSYTHLDVYKRQLSVLPLQISRDTVSENTETARPSSGPR